LAQSDFLGDRESVDVEVGRKGVGRKVTAQDDGIEFPPSSQGFRKRLVSTNV
jgi:hypothetical protein